MKANETFEMLLKQYGAFNEKKTAIKFQKYLKLLQKWNKKINLTASTEWTEIGPLFSESIWAAQFYANTKSLHLDIGSGAGFPAIPIRILNPNISLNLVESRTKKAIFLETLIDELELSSTHVHNQRLEEYLQTEECTWDCISWKGIKLEDMDICRIINRSNQHTRFWMFHGNEPAVINQDIISQKLRLIRSEKFPDRNDWKLSIYSPQ